MKKTHKKYYVFAGIAVFSILVFLLVVYILMPRGKPVVLYEPDVLLKIVEDGDIICRLGDRFWSGFFRDVSAVDRRYSHIGIIRINGDRITVIHAEGTTEPKKDFVKEETFEDFIKIARTIGIYRINDANGSQISNLATEYLDLPFDWQFDMYDNSKLYCTELLYVILKRLMPELELNTVFIKELGREIIPLEAVSNSEYFTEIFFSTTAMQNGK
ncbi:MAG: hypothetical protein LBI12_01380 [Treponema sp.]|jgi:hypothetical protein|nr:hypothetical protein [Treponema sp.]